MSKKPVMPVDCGLSRSELMYYCFMCGYRYSLQDKPTLATIDVALKAAGLGEYLDEEEENGTI